MTKRPVDSEGRCLTARTRPATRHHSSQAPPFEATRPPDERFTLQTAPAIPGFNTGRIRAKFAPVKALPDWR